MESNPMAQTAETVLTLVAPSLGGLSDRHIGTVRAALKDQQASLCPTDWLSEGEACDISFDNCLPDVAEAVVRQALAATDLSPVDLFVQPSADRQKMLLIADMDSTMVTSETLDDLAAHAGLKDKISAITERAMRGELDFESALRERVGMLKGLRAEALDETLAEIVYMPGAKTLVATMRAAGATCLLVSGGFTAFTSKVAAHLGFHDDRANTLHVENGVLTGTVGEPILGRDAKLHTLVTEAGKLRLPLVRTVAVGDGANDLAMIQAAGLGVAYHAKPLVQEAARFRVNHCDQTALLFAQGYRRINFVEG
jgi:phosphoserine phosphatase